MHSMMQSIERLSFRYKDQYLVAGRYTYVYAL